MAKQRRLQRSVDLAAGTITFTDLSKTDKDGNHPSISVEYKKFPKEMQERAIAHGWNAKLGDVAASDQVDAIPTIQATVDAIMASNWGRQTGAGGPRVTLQAEALHQALVAKAKEAKVEAPTIEAVTELLEGMSKEQRRALDDQYPEVAAIKARLKAEREAQKAKDKAAKAKSAKPAGNLLDLFKAA